MYFRLLCGLLILLCLVTVADAQLPSPALDFVYPAGGQAGTTVRVHVGGRDLDEAQKLVFSHPGITSRHVMRPPSEFETEPQPLTDQFEVTIPLNVDPATYDLRVVGRFGVSTPCGFVVGDTPEWIETGEHHTFETASELPLDVVVNGYTDEGAVDYYRFSATKGQALMIECLARPIDTKLAPVITIWDASKRQLARSAHLFDPFVDFQVPAAGTYVLGINDHTFNGGINRHYRLRIHTGPYLVTVSPIVSQAGAAATFTVEGRNLPDGEIVPDVKLGAVPLERQTISLFLPPRQSSLPVIVDAVSTTTDAFLFRWPTNRGSSNPLVLTYAQQPVIVEAEANNTPETAQKVSVPCEYSGRFYPRRDQDWVQFTAARGQAYQVRVFSNRLGHPTDPEIFVQKVTQSADGQSQTSQVSTEDDSRSDRDRYRQTPRRGLELSHRDPVVRFTADEDGEYRIGMRDLSGGSLDDPRFAYRLLIEPERPDFQLLAWTQRQATDDDKKIDRQSLVVPRGGTLPVLIDVLRQGGSDQPVRVWAKQLPDGVTASECHVAAGKSEAVLMLTATSDAPAWCGPIQIMGEATIDGQVVQRMANEAVLMGNTENVEQQRPTARLARQTVLAVVDQHSAPAEVRVGSADAPTATSWETSVGGNLAIPIFFTKRAELKGDLTLAAVGLPDTIKVAEIKLAPDATADQLQLVLDSADTPPGNYTVFLRGIITSSFARNPDAIARAQSRREGFNDVIAQLDQQVQQAADQFARAEHAVARQAAMLGRFEGVPQAIQPTLEAATQQVAQIEQQLATLPSSSDLSNLAPAPSASTSHDIDLVTELDEVAQSVRTATAEAVAQLRAAHAGAGRMGEQLSAAKAELQTATDDVARAEAAHKQAMEKRQRADEFVKQLDQQLADAQKNFGPVDVASYVHSPAFLLRVVGSPLISEVPAEPVKMRRGETREVPVTIQRRFGFADAVQVSLRAPEQSPHIVAEPRRIEKNRNSNTLQVTVGADALPGEHTLEVVLTLKFNGVEVQDQVPLKVAVNQP